MNPLDTAPIYVFITGFDGDDNPQFVESQQNVIGVIPGDEGYSAFCQSTHKTNPLLFDLTEHLCYHAYKLTQFH